MTFAAVLDTCVLYPAHLRDTLLRLTERGLYRALWSADIVEELRRNLTEVVDPLAVDHLLGQMTAAFPDAEVTGYQALIDGLTCDPKDRHVLASAVRANAGAGTGAGAGVRATGSGVAGRGVAATEPLDEASDSRRFTDDEFGAVGT